MRINPAQFEHGVNYCYMETVIKNRKESRPKFSVFTTCYNTFEKIQRPYKSLKAQPELDWEWVIVDDSPDEDHWNALKARFSQTPKIRLYRRAQNSGNIGNVKNEAIGLCRGEFVLELDHDDEIGPDLLKDAIAGFAKFPEVGFIYMDFRNCYEDGRNFSYGDFLCKGFGGYYYQYCAKAKKWVNVFVTPQLNNITASYLFSMPNHPRIWRREKLLEVGSYSEFLPICDDQEILLRTIIDLKILKIPKLAYTQYFNDGGSNFSLLRNKEINRIGPKYLTPQFKAKHPFEVRLKAAGAWLDVQFDRHPQPIWKLPEFTPTYVNKLFHPDYDRQIAIVGTGAFERNLEKIRELYRNPRNDFFYIDNSVEPEVLFAQIVAAGLERIKCYVLKGASKSQLVNYFERIYRCTDESVILD